MGEQSLSGERYVGSNPTPFTIVAPLAGNDTSALLILSKKCGQSIFRTGASSQYVGSGVFIRSNVHCRLLVGCLLTNQDLVGGCVCRGSNPPTDQPFIELS